MIDFTLLIISEIFEWIIKAIVLVVSRVLNLSQGIKKLFRR